MLRFRQFLSLKYFDSCGVQSKVKNIPLQYIFAIAKKYPLRVTHTIGYFI